MSQEFKVNPEPKRIQLLEDVRRVLYEGMKKAEQARNWEVFSRYADAYRRLNA